MDELLVVLDEELGGGVVRVVGHFLLSLLVEIGGGGGGSAEGKHAVSVVGALGSLLRGSHGGEGDSLLEVGVRFGEVGDRAVQLVEPVLDGLEARGSLGVELVLVLADLLVELGLDLLIPGFGLGGQVSHGVVEDALDVVVSSGDLLFGEFGACLQLLLVELLPAGTRGLEPVFDGRWVIAVRHCCIGNLPAKLVHKVLEPAD